MARCFFRNSNGDQCENEALQENLYCRQHEQFEKDTDKKVSHLISAFTHSRKIGNENKKDFWDKVSASATLISGLFVGLIGIIATTTYNNRELASQKAERSDNIQVRRVEIVQKFFPHLVASEKGEQRGALLAIASLGDEKLATDLAKNFGGSESLDVLNQLAGSKDPQIAKEAKAALSASIIAERLRSVALYLAVEYTAPNGMNQRFGGTAFLVSDGGYAITAAHMFPDTSEGDIRIDVSTGDTSASQSAHVISKDVDRDVALIRIKSDQEFDSLEFEYNPPQIAETVYSVGFPASRSFNTALFIQGQISTLNGPKGLWGTDMDTGAGFSGAPVANTEGKIIGFVTSRLVSGGAEGLSLIRPLSELRDILSIANVRF